MDNVFLDIISGKLEANFIYKDEVCVAFYDKFPVSKGHFLVVPIKRQRNITLESDETAAHLINVARKLAKQEVLDKGGQGFKILINTNAPEQSVFHTHVHVIPY